MANAGPTRKTLAAYFIGLGYYLPEHLGDGWTVAALGIVGAVVVALVGAKGQRG